MTRSKHQRLPGRARGLAGFALLALGLCVAATALGQALGPVDKNFFGLVMNRSNPQLPWPTVPFGSWRLWDARVTWPDLEPRRGEWRFSNLDSLVAEAQAHSVRPLLVLAHSPEWASSRPTEPSAYKPGVVASPARMDDWRNYVSTVGQRYKGKIKEYQIWNEPSDKTHYSGTVAQLVEMTCDAYRILKTIDPEIKVVSAGSAGGGRHIKYLDDFLAAGGAQCIDVVAHHFYVPRFGPEAMVPQIREVRQVMQRQGVGGLPLWTTEIGWWIANVDGRPDSEMVSKGGWRKIDANAELAAVIARSFLITRSEGVARVYWYSWANTYAWGLSGLDERPKPGAEQWSQVAAMMLGNSIQGFASGADHQYQCDVVSIGGSIARLAWRDAEALVPREGARKGALDERFMPRWAAVAR